MEKLDEKILEVAKWEEPMIWWREYPPRFIIRDKSINEDIVRHYLKMVFQNGNQRIGVYVHIPFCKARCLFCRYYLKTKKNDQEINHYLASLEEELHLYGHDSFNKINLDSLYIGGGTPTLLNQRQLKKLFQIINRFFKFKKNAQILVEGTPDTLEYKKLCLLKNLGVNRLTIGAQIFDDYVLKRSGRLHSVKDIYRVFQSARKTKIKYINFDMILGLPGETSASYDKIIKGIKDLRPDCVSFAPLSLGRGVAYSEKRVERCFINKDFKKFNFSERFGSLYDILKKEGYQNLNGHPRSYLALNGIEEAMNLNSLGRWEFDSIFSLGSSAASFLYFKNNSQAHLLEYVGIADLNRRSSLLKKKKLPILYGFEFNEDELIRRYLTGQLAYWGKIRKKRFSDKLGQDPVKVINQKFPLLRHDKLIVEKGNSIIIKNIKFPVSRRDFFLFCIKYLYSPRVINLSKKYISQKYD